MDGSGNGPVAPKRTFYQRLVLRDILRRARKHQGEPLSSEDWAAVWELNDSPSDWRELGATAPSVNVLRKSLLEFAAAARSAVRRQIEAGNANESMTHDASRAAPR